MILVLLIAFITFHAYPSEETPISESTLAIQVLHLIPRPFYQICRLTHSTTRPTLN